MRKKFLKRLLSVVIISTVAIISATSTAASASSYTFDVISDTHYGATSYNGSTKTINTLNCIKNRYPKDKCIVINGDVVDNNQNNTYNNLYSDINRIKSGLPYIYFNYGNHEFMSNPATNKTNPPKQANFNDNLTTFNRVTNNIDRLLLTKPSDITGNLRNGRYSEQTVCGNTFVFLGSDKIVSSNTDSAYLNSSDLKKLQNVINNNKNNNPIFVFVHQPIYNTTTGSTRSDWGYVTNSTDFKNIIKDHPEVIVFTSHTHVSLSDTKNYYSFGNNKAKVFSTSTVSDTNTPEGYHITVQNNKVQVSSVQYRSANGTVSPYRTTTVYTK